MRARILLALLSASVLAVWALLFVRVGRDPVAPRQRPEVSSVGPGEPDARAYAPDSVFRPDVDRPEPVRLPPGALHASFSFGPEDARPFSYFGHAVALDGETAVVGAPYDDGEGTDAGAAYVFRRGEDGWRQVARLTAPEAWDFDRFGFSVAVRQGTVAVGADRRDRGGGLDCGAVYVFRERDGGWRLESVLQPEDLGAKDALGISVAVDGDAVVAGAPGQNGSGAAYIFSFDGRGWQQQAKLTAPSSSGYAGFGHAVAISGDAALVGAPTTDEPAVLSGAAYVFRRQGGGWRLEARLASANAVSLEKFGASVALDGDLALVGSPRAALGDSTRAGAAFVFQRSGGGWRQTARIQAPSPRSDEEFGRAVALAPGRAIVGSSFGDAAGLNTGVAYLFERQGERWNARGAVFATEPAAVEEFGTSVAVSGSRALIGAPRQGRHGNAAGAAYVFQSHPSTLPSTGGDP
ncbi:MAG TPA: FG-GAP repeat protein [Thermoanaerobaculia bacterium]|nr:FG-GAP repeat protein [Thermoanaerobaculia bacterium]